MITLAELTGLVLSPADELTAISLVQDAGEVRQYRIWALPAALAWKIERLGSGEAGSFDPATMQLTDGEDKLTLAASRIPSSFPLCVRLAFPLALPIWGRAKDEYCPVSVTEETGQYIVLLRHISDAGIFGSLSVDKTSGRAVRLVTPSEVLKMKIVDD